MAHQLYNHPKAVALDTSANVYPGAKLEFFLTGTSTHTDTYTTSALSVAHTNPVVADSAGVFPAIYLNPSIVYKATYTTSADVLIYTQDPVNDQVLSQAVIGLFLYPRTATEIAVGVTPANYAYPPGDVKRYGAIADWDGALGGGGTDNAAAFRRAFSIMAVDGTPVLLGSGRYRLIVNGGDANISTIDSINGTSIHSDGAWLYFDGTFTGSQFVEVFSFRDCNGVSLVGALNVNQYPLASAGAGANRGIELFKFWDGCTSVRTGPIFATGVRSIITWRRNSVSDPKGSGGFHELINGVDVGYGLNTILSGDNLTANIVTVRAVRSYYPYGVENHTIDINSQDHWGNADVNISSAVGNGCTGLTIKYTNLNSTVADATVNCVKVSFTDQTPAIHRNIHVTLNISAATSADYLGYSFVLEKLDNGGSADTVDRGHTLDGLTVDHTLNGKNGNHRSINIGQIGTWGTGEFITNLRIPRFRSSGGGQPNIHLTSLQDVANIDNIYSSAQFNLTGSTVAGSRVQVSNANVNGWSVGGGLCYLMDEKEVSVAYSTSMTIPSFEGSRFVITATDGVAFAVAVPSNPAIGKSIVVTIRNNSGGVLGAATWNAVFKMASWTNPAAANSRSIAFNYNGTNWVQIAQTGVDVPI